MSSFDRVEPFVHTAEKLSFREAARHLGVTPAAVSKAVAALEEELGVKLLQRNSRHVALTPEGEIYLSHCREALDKLALGRELATREAPVPKGRLRVTMSFVLGRPITRALPLLLARHPELDLELSCGDVQVSLVEREIDVALRIGELEDSSLVSRRLRSPRWITVASPRYLSARKAPQSVADLRAHTCMHFALPTGQLAQWRLVGESGAEEPFLASRPVVFDHGELLLDGALAGVGIAQVFDFMARDLVAQGDLVEVLPGRSGLGPPIHALCPQGRQKSPKIRAFIDFAIEILGEGGAVSGPSPGSRGRDG